VAPPAAVKKKTVRRSINDETPVKLRFEMTISLSMRAWRRRRLVGNGNRR
jgi:hypothetical protein